MTRKTTNSLSLSTLMLAMLCTPMMAAAADDSAAKETETYPLDTCVVSGEKLGEMGDSYVFKYEGEEVRLCCKDCLKKFKKDPEKYLKKLHEAKKVDKQGPADNDTQGN